MLLGVFFIIIFIFLILKLDNVILITVFLFLIIVNSTILLFYMGLHFVGSLYLIIYGGGILVLYFVILQFNNVIYYSNFFFSVKYLNIISLLITLIGSLQLTILQNS